MHREEDISYRQFEKLARDRGHSTPNMAGRFAAQIGENFSLSLPHCSCPTEAKQLILTHFSGRYSTADTPELKSIMQRIINIAQEAGQPNLRPHSVTAASDFLNVKVPIAIPRSGSPDLSS